MEATIHGPVHPLLINACRKLIDRNQEKVKSLNLLSSNNTSMRSFEDDDEEYFRRMFMNDIEEDEDNEDEEDSDYMWDDDDNEIEEEIKVPKKKKKKIVLTEEELKRKEEEKAARKAHKQAIKKAHLEAKELKRRQKEEREAAEMKNQAEIKSIELAARRDYLRKQLNNINLNKRKSAAKLAAINIELKEIENELNNIKEVYDIEVPNINEGSKVKRFFKGVKNSFITAGKKIKKYCKKNSELIKGLASVIIPVALAYTLKVII